jgi:hypothetical protein
MRDPPGAYWRGSAARLDLVAVLGCQDRPWLAERTGGQLPKKRGDLAGSERRATLLATGSGSVRKRLTAVHTAGKKKIQKYKRLTKSFFPLGLLS